jgi:predicted transcriptional regulator
LTFHHKRDRIQVIAEILGLCRSPQTQTYIRRQTSVSYSVLQSCLMYLLTREWIIEVESASGQNKLAVTEKGMVFLEKWVELQNLAGLNNKRALPLGSLGRQAVKVHCR